MALLIAVAVACAPAQQPAPPPVPPSSAPSPASPVTSPPARETADLASEFAAFAAGLDAVVGVAVTPVGGGPVLTLGTSPADPVAWSTAKVPLAMAVLREQPTSQPSDAMRAAIDHSDNAAAQVLWAGLGEPETAKAKMEAVLREAGDPTVVQSVRVRPEFSAFGQSRWSISDQAAFLSHAACDPRNNAVFALMGEIQSDQHWGLGRIADTQFKGGWGPAPDGTYLVRQFGVLPTAHGRIAVAVAAVDGSGTFAGGTGTLDVVTDWLEAHIGELPAGDCPAE